MVKAQDLLLIGGAFLLLSRLGLAQQSGKVLGEGVVGVGEGVVSGVFQSGVGVGTGLFDALFGKPTPSLTTEQQVQDAVSSLPSDTVVKVSPEAIGEDRVVSDYYKAGTYVRFKDFSRGYLTQDAHPESCFGVENTDKFVSEVRCWDDIGSIINQVY